MHAVVVACARTVQGGREGAWKLGMWHDGIGAAASISPSRVDRPTVSLGLKVSADAALHAPPQIMHVHAPPHTPLQFNATMISTRIESTLEYWQLGLPHAALVDTSTSIVPIV